MKTQISLIRGDITAADADAIVNSANNDLVLGGGVSGAIRRVAGTAVQEECHQIGTIPLGTAVVTSGGQLKAQWIIHAAVNPLGLWADAKSVRNAAKNALVRAEEKKVRRLAFPAIGTGAGALPVERCADILMDEVLRHCGGETSLEEVMFVVYDEKPFLIFEEKYKERMAKERGEPWPPPAPPAETPPVAAPVAVPPPPAVSAAAVPQAAPHPDPAAPPPPPAETPPAP